MNGKLQRFWHFWLGEPFWWIFLAFFQPQRFRREFLVHYPQVLQRFSFLFRIAILMALICHSLILINDMILMAVNIISFNAIEVVLRVFLIMFVSWVFVIIMCGLISLSFIGFWFLIWGFVAWMIIELVLSPFTYKGDLIIFQIEMAILLGMIVGMNSKLENVLAINLGEILILFLGVGILGMWNFLTLTFAFTISSIISCARLPFYVLDSISLLKVYYASYKRPQNIFNYLHHSALYWNEIIFLPLPLLKQTLLLAYDVASEKALEEIAFIIAERPRQLKAAQTVALETIIRDLEARKSLELVAQAANRLTEVLSFSIKPADTDKAWFKSIMRLSDASRDAIRAISPISLRGRRKALEDMQANLLKVHPDVAFPNQRLNARLTRIVETWRMLAHREKERLSKFSQDIGGLDNPYKPGQFLMLQDSLFVGRRDLAKDLEGALSLESRRPTFLLNGERRMGKTSALQQLPYLLGSSYISAFYNLQQPGLYANTATFLSFLADGIRSVMEARAISVENLGHDALREEIQTNDARVYRAFEQWLGRIETILEREMRTLLLVFDEFEMLEEIELAKYMKVRPLLNWMRSVIQFHPRIVLLFSGVKTFDEMGKQAGIDWNGYFINVQMLRVSFLKPDEARHLVVHPTPTYPGEAIFPSEVVEMILAETGCHPFLLQAMCSALITLLNLEQKERAVSDDVVRAREKVLSDWTNHFIYLWNGSDEPQRACLETLLTQTCADSQWLSSKTGLEAKVVRAAVRQLLKRDLVVSMPDETYRLATPLFRYWLNKNK